MPKPLATARPIHPITFLAACTLSSRCRNQYAHMCVLMCALAPTHVSCQGCKRHGKLRVEATLKDCWRTNTELCNLTTETAMPIINIWQLERRFSLKLLRVCLKWYVHPRTWVRFWLVCESRLLIHLWSTDHDVRVGVHAARRCQWLGY